MAIHCIKPSGHLSGLGKSLDRLGCTIQSIPLSAMYGNIILHFFYQYTFVEKPQQGNLLEWFERNVPTVSEVEMCKLYQRWGRQAVWPLSKSLTLPLYYKSLPATALHWKIFPICTVQLLWPSPVEASSSLARLCLAKKLTLGPAGLGFVRIPNTLGQSEPLPLSTLSTPVRQ